MCNQALAHNECILRHVPDNLKTQEVCDTGMPMDSSTIMVLDGVLLRLPSVLLLLVPDHIKTQRMCKEAVEKKSVGAARCRSLSFDARNV